MKHLEKLPNLAFIDLETTGLDRQKHEIIEIALLKAIQPKYEIIDTWETKVKPQKIETADRKALKITGYNAKDWEIALEPKIAFEMLAAKVKNCLLVAHNVAFDRAFLEDHFRKWKIPITWDYHSLDTITLAYYKLGPEQKLKLSEITKTLKIKRHKEHQASKDVWACYEVFKKLMSSKN